MASVATERETAAGRGRPEVVARRRTMAGIAAAGAAGVAGAFGACLRSAVAAPVAPEVAHRPSPLPDRVVLTLRGDPAHTQAVTWRTDPSVDAPQAQLALAGGGPGFKTDATGVPSRTIMIPTNLGYESSYHTVEFEGLQPQTRYLYRVGDGEQWSEWSEFTTASTEPAPFSFLYVGDAQNDIREHWSRVVRRAFGSLPDARFIVHAGDLVDVGDRDQLWGEWFQGADWATRTIPSLPTPGNHEYSADAATKGLAPQWRPQFALPENGPAGLASAAGTAYFLDYQGVRLISLDSNLELAVQAAWLRDVLRDNPNRWTVATFHHPVFSTALGRDNKALREQWLPILDKQVDLVLQGHDHTYGRGHVAVPGNPTRGGGAVYVVSVSGPKMYELSRANWEDNGATLVRAAEQTQLYQLIHVAGDTLRYEARTATGMPFDSFSLIKQPNGVKLLRETDGGEVRLDPTA